jgi:selenocysteine lyase/cysteine desulfurase
MSAILASPPPLDVLGADVHVPLLDGTLTRSVNLDYAATAPALASVHEAVARVLPLSGSVHRGAGLPSQAASALYEACRARVAEHLGATADQHTIFVRSTTDAANLLARAVPGDVVALDVEHHANLLPWRGLRCVEHAPSLEATIARLEAELAARPAALLAVTGASNVTGERLPLRRLAELAHAYGARLYVDAAQLAPHRAIDIAADGIDYLAFSGHKLYAPYGSGVLIGRADWLDAAAPYLAGGGAVRDVAIGRTQWTTGPSRHEAGTPNLAGAVAIAAALKALAPAPREAHEDGLRELLLDGLAEIPGVRTLRIWSDSEDAVGVVAFTVDGYAPGHIGAYLAAEHGIGVRDGRFCAHPLLRRFGLQGALRASFGAGSVREDAERLIEALWQRPAHAYRPDGLRWTPVHDTRDLAAWDLTRLL